MGSARFLPDRPAEGVGHRWDALKARAVTFWLALPPRWRSDGALLSVAAVIAVSLLAAFHQVVNAGAAR